VEISDGNREANHLNYWWLNTSPAVGFGDFEMADVSNDQLVLIRIEGMHCHKCERSIQQALSSNEGVHEVEVDFASGQASVLFDRDRINVKQLLNAVESAGYHAAGFTQNKAGTAAL
jgi:copper chaperone CopZ